MKLKARHILASIVTLMMLPPGSPAQSIAPYEVGLRLKIFPKNLKVGPSDRFGFQPDRALPSVRIVRIEPRPSNRNAEHYLSKPYAYPNKHFPIYPLDTTLADGKPGREEDGLLYVLLLERGAIYDLFWVGSSPSNKVHTLDPGLPRIARIQVSKTASKRPELQIVWDRLARDNQRMSLSNWFYNMETSGLPARSCGNSEANAIWSLVDQSKTRNAAYTELAHWGLASYYNLRGPKALFDIEFNRAVQTTWRLAPGDAEEYCLPSGCGQPPSPPKPAPPYTGGGHWGWGGHYNSGGSGGGGSGHEARPAGQPVGG